MTLKLNLQEQVYPDCLKFAAFLRRQYEGMALFDEFHRLQSSLTCYIQLTVYIRYTSDWQVLLYGDNV